MICKKILFRVANRPSENQVIKGGPSRPLSGPERVKRSKVHIKGNIVLIRPCGLQKGIIHGGKLTFLKSGVLKRHLKEVAVGP